MRAGVVDRLLDHPTAGYGVVVRDDDGWEYHLYHVNNDTPGTDDGADTGTWRFADGIRPGATVQAGQLIAWMGDSGNSEGSVPHAHVEIHRPDGTADQSVLEPAPGPTGRQLRDRASCDDRSGDRSGLAAVRLALRPVASGLETDGVDGRPSGIVCRRGADVDRAGRIHAGRRRGPSSRRRPLRRGPRLHESRRVSHQPLPAELGPILATIREMESGGDYTAEASASTASGAYQFVDSSWAGYGGYARASHAPPSVQDAKAAEHAAAILARNGGDVSTVPVSWYLGHVPVGAEWDAVPPYPGNHLTPREYQSRWMQTYTENARRTRRLGRSATPLDTSRDHDVSNRHRGRRRTGTSRVRPDARAEIRERDVRSSRAGHP